MADAVEIPGFPGYFVNTSGQIISGRSGRPLKATFKSPTSRVLCVTIRSSTVSVAATVAAEFMEPRPPGHRLDYKDGNPENCAVDNLEWVPTQKVIAAELQLSPRAFRRRLGA